MEKLRQLEYHTHTNEAKQVKAVIPFMTKSKLLNKDNRADLFYAMTNGDADKISAIVDANNMRREYEAVRKVLDELREQGLDVGLAIGKLEDAEYFPRKLIDAKGMLNAMWKGDRFSVFTRKIKEFAKELGVSYDQLPNDLKADLINRMLESQHSGLGGLSPTKQRKFEHVPPELMPFYADPMTAIIGHIHDMTKHIEYRKFLGRIPQKVALIRTNLGKAQAGIIRFTREMHDEDATQEERDKAKESRNELIGIEKELSAYMAKYMTQRDYKENIATYIIESIANGEIAPDKEYIVQKVLSARLHEKGAHSFASFYQNFTYLDTMGSPISALTQLGDYYIALYQGGVLGGMKSIGKAITGNVKINREDLGLSHAAQEFTEGGTLSGCD